MMAVNLIPAHRIVERRRQKRLRIWAAVVVVWIAALGAGHISLLATDHDDSAELYAAIGLADAEIKQLEQAGAALRAEITEAEATLRARRAVGDQPDWGLLLAMLAARIDGRGVLSACTLAAGGEEEASGRRSDAGRRRSNIIRPREYNLSLTGLTRTQDAASEVALALEQTSIFERVILLEARRSVFHGDEAVTFRLECTMLDSAAEVR